MSSLVDKAKISKVTMTDEDGNESEYSGEGFLIRRGHGSQDIRVVELIMKVQK